MSAPLASDSLVSPAASADAGPAYGEIIRTIGMFRRVMDPYFARFGVSGAQWAVLRNLHCAENRGQPSLRPADLVGRLLVRPPSVTNVVERLRVAGLVLRETSETDHRAKAVRLTEAGRQLVLTIKQEHAKQIANVMAGLGGEEQTTLRNLLRKLNTHLELIAPNEYVAEPMDEGED